MRDLPSRWDAEQVFAWLSERVQDGMSEWQPIETAPMDGTHILVWNRDQPQMPPFTAHWWWQGGFHLSVNYLGEYSDFCCSGLTHWRPIPKPPAEIA
jgi:Protein of unknown function (DUF551)